MSLVVNHRIEFEGINNVFLGRATWFAERDAMRRETIVGWRARGTTPVLRVSDDVIEDATNGYRPLASRCIDLYTNHHRIVEPFYARPTLTCGACRAPVDVPSDQEMDHEFCERQAVLWMQRAEKVRL